MGTGLVELKARATALGMPGSLIRANMNNAEKLQSLIDAFENGKSHVEESKSPKKREATKMARPVARAKAKAKVGRPTVKAPVGRKQTPVAAAKAAQKKNPVGRPRKVATVGKSKPAATKKVARKVSSDESGRNILGKVNYRLTEGWNPREGSATYIIFQELKKSKGDRDAVFNTLKKQAKRLFKGAADPVAMLKYRIARCDWDFALQTGQHEKSANRIEYGSGSNGTKSKGKARAATKKAVAAAPAKRGPGRPKGSTTAKAKRPVGRPKARR